MTSIRVREQAEGNILDLERRDGSICHTEGFWRTPISINVDKKRKRFFIDVNTY